MYVYIFEDGTTQNHVDPPTTMDKEAIAEGLLLVLHADSDVRYVNEHGESETLTECRVETCKLGRYHTTR